MDIYLESNQDLKYGDHFVIDGQMYRVVYGVGDGLVCQGIDWDTGIEPVQLQYGSIRRVMTSEDF
jgi:hypothetical protein